MRWRPVLAVILVAWAGALAWALLRDRGEQDGGGDSASRGASPSQRRPNLVLLVIDTLRADALAADPRSSAGTHMPAVAAIAADGVGFAQACAPSSWTMPSLASLLTGLVPHRHRALDSLAPPALPPEVATYAEVLAAHGYETAAIVDTTWLGSRAAIARGFRRLESPLVLANPVRLRRWLDERPTDRPFFLYLHTNDVHEPYGEANHQEEEPYNPRPDPAWVTAEEMTRAFFLDRTRRRVLSRTHGDRFVQTVVDYMDRGFAAASSESFADELREAYFSGVRWTDGNVARVLQTLREHEALDDETVLVIASDHGEAFGEGGMLGHGRQLHEAVVRIPLVMRGPAPLAGGRRIEESVGLIDVLPTFLDLAGLPAIEGADGRSLLPLVRGETGGHPVLSEEIRNESNTRRQEGTFLASLRTERWKYVAAYDWRAGTVTERLHDLERDPDERVDLYATEVPPALPDDLCAAIEDVRALLWGGGTDLTTLAKGALTPPTRPQPPSCVRAP
jgi:arylsulfatase A-like enzyme